jgi:hypothetical protein
MPHCRSRLKWISEHLSQIMARYWVSEKASGHCRRRLKWIPEYLSQIMARYSNPQFQIRRLAGFYLRLVLAEATFAADTMIQFFFVLLKTSSLETCLGCNNSQSNGRLSLMDQLEY